MAWGLLVSASDDFVPNPSLKPIHRPVAPGEHGEFWGKLVSQGQRYWSGETKLFSEKPLALFWSPHRPIFIPRDGGEVWGVGFDWQWPLEPGYEYTFTFDFRLPDLPKMPRAAFPDLIAVDGQIVWTFDQRSRPDALHLKLAPFAHGTAHSRDTSVVFPYRPRALGQGEIWLVRDTRRGWHKAADAIAVPDLFTRWFHVCHRKPTQEPPPAYPAWKPPHPVVRSPKLIPGLLDCQRPLDWKGKPLARPDYPTDDVRLGMTLGPDQAKDPALFDLLECIGLDGAWLVDLPESEDALAKMRAQAAKGALRYALVDCDQLDRIDPARQDQAVNMVNRLHREFPGLQVHLMFSELMIPTLGRHRELELFPRFEGNPYNYATFSDESIQRGPAMQREWMRSAVSRLEHPERVRTMMMVTPAAEPLWNYYRAGPTMVMKKSIHRESIQVSLANARGAARMHGKPWAFRTDNWLYWNSTGVWPLEMEQAWRVAFASGASLIDLEGGFAAVPTSQGTRFTETAAAVARAAQWIRRHPTRGRQIVPIAVLRAPHDRWGHLPFWPDLPLMDELEPERHRLLRTYSLFSLFFANLGNYQHTRYDRYCTGTPFGPVDQIMTTAEMALLNTYRFVIYMGLEPIEPEAGPRLLNFVRRGGTLFCPVGALTQLRERDHKSLRAMTVGQGTGKDEDLPTAGDWPAGKVFDRLAVELKGAKPLISVGDAPLVTRTPEGKGEVWCVATEYLGDLSYDLLAALVKAAAQPHAPLRIEPANDRVEYTLQRKDGCYVLNIFRHVDLNHVYTDRHQPAPFPCTVRLNLDHLSAFGAALEALEVSETMETRRLEAQRQPPYPSVPLALGRHAELVIAPAGKARAAFLAAQ
ncbi:MAG: hypothetical protein FJ279_22655 [Planctomycetes bacterium]|nr:hypothetical protein [Planctomycetota bacterium]